MDGEIRTPIGVMWMEEGVLWHRLETTETITEDHAGAVVDAVRELTRDRPVPAVVDMSNIGFATAAARSRFAGSSEESNESATALIVRGPASRLMAQAFLKVGRPQRPIAVFTDSRKAANWAKERR